MNSKNCLMLETSDKKRLFTEMSNFDDVRNFAQDFGFRLSEVELEQGEILSLERLAQAIAEKHFSRRPKFTVQRYF